jgi:hypothetical protein
MCQACHLRADQFDGALMVDNPAWATCERVAVGRASGEGAGRVLSESELLLRAMFDVGYSRRTAAARMKHQRLKAPGANTG